MPISDPGAGQAPGRDAAAPAVTGMAGAERAALAPYLLWLALLLLCHGAALLWLPLGAGGGMLATAAAAGLTLALGRVLARQGRPVLVWPGRLFGFEVALVAPPVTLLPHLHGLPVDPVGGLALVALASGAGAVLGRLGTRAVDQRLGGDPLASALAVGGGAAMIATLAAAALLFGWAAG